MDAQEQQLKILALAKQDLSNASLEACWNRFDLPSKGAGALVAIAGGALLSVVLPGWGQFVGWGLGMLIAWQGNQIAGRDGDAIEAGDVAAIERYLPELEQKRILEPYVGALESAKKLPGTANQPPQTSQFATTKQGNGSPSPSVSAVPTPIAFDQLIVPAMASSIILASVRGTGKTSLLQAVLANAEPGYILGLDPKNSGSFGALSPFFSYLPGERGQMYSAAIRSVVDELNFRNESGMKPEQCQPLWLIVDEFQTTKSLWAKPIKEKIISSLELIIAQGRERKVFVVLLGQSPLCKDLGLSSGVRDNVEFLALGCNAQGLEKGGGGGWDSVDRIVIDANLIPSQNTRRIVQEQLTYLKNQAGESGRVLVSTRGAGTVPDLSKMAFSMPHKKWQWELTLDDDIEGATPKPKVDEPEVNGESIEAKVLHHLRLNPDGLSLGELKQKISQFKRGKVDAQQFLERMATEGMIISTVTPDGNSMRFSQVEGRHLDT